MSHPTLCNDDQHFVKLISSIGSTKEEKRKEVNPLDDEDDDFKKVITSGADLSVDKRVWALLELIFPAVFSSFFILL